jgi:hypothetical protein
MGEVAAEEATRQPSSLFGVPVTRRNVSNLAMMTLATLWPPNVIVLVRNALALRRNEPWRDYVERRGTERATLDTLARRALAWIRRSQDRVGSGGVGDFRFHGWSSGYPEVTGYIIPTFWDYHHALGNDDLAQRAIRMADWELGIQKDEGGFESRYHGEGQPSVVFNTGQVIRGLVRTYQETGEHRYLHAAVRAGDWIVANQEPDGSWAKANYLGMKRTYDAYAAAALARLSNVTSNDAYAQAAIANCEFVLRNQHDNGWFELCDNTQGGNDAPITHTICYTIDGLTETGEALGEDRFTTAADLAARALLGGIEPGGRLPGRFDRDWRPRASYVVLTGSGQLGVILAKLHRRTGDETYLKTSRRLLDFLAFVQELNAIGRNRSGGIAGSYPIWGRYVPLKYPSWATKFFLDHLLLVRATDRSA